MTTGEDLIAVEASPDLEGVPRTYSSNAYFSKSDIGDADAWLPVLETLAANLWRVKPREDLVFWTHDVGAGELSLGMTRPRGSKRELLPLLEGIARPLRGHGRGYLAEEPRPVLRWRSTGQLVRLWPADPPADAPELLGGVPVVNRRYRLVGSTADKTGDGMRLETIDLQNVLRFERFEATFAPSFNVVIGDNGAGKTTLLTLLRRVLSVWTQGSPRAVKAVDLARETIRVENGTPYRQPHRPWHLRVSGRAPTGIPLLHEEEDHRVSVDNQGAARFHRAAEQDVGVPLPVLVYFSPWREPPAKRKPVLKPKGPPRRLDGYHDALDLHADFKDFAAWFKAFEMQRVEGGKSVPAVEAARETVIRCIPGCTDLRWVPVLNDIVVRIDGENHLIWRLSDGFRTMLALVGEVAWRAAVLNPALGGGVAREVEGIVLIDELDLHLHPRWQRRVVADLRAAFPKVQFIATTHSPFVVQSMRADEVINLDGRPPMQYWREGIEDIAEESMGVEESRRSELYRELETAAEEYYRLLDTKPTAAADLASKKARLDELEARFTDNPALAAFLRTQRIAREGQT